MEPGLQSGKRLERAEIKSPVTRHITAASSPSSFQRHLAESVALLPSRFFSYFEYLGHRFMLKARYILRLPVPHQCIIIHIFIHDTAGSYLPFFREQTIAPLCSGRIAAFTVCNTNHYPYFEHSG